MKTLRTTQSKYNPGSSLKTFSSSVAALLPIVFNFLFLCTESYATETLNGSLNTVNKTDTYGKANHTKPGNIYLFYESDGALSEQWKDSLQRLFSAHKIITVNATKHSIDECGTAMVSLGSDALQAAISSHPACNHYAVYVPQAQHFRVAEKHSDINLQTVYLDPHPVRQVLLGSLIQPQSNKVSILAKSVSPLTNLTVELIESANLSLKLSVDTLDSSHSLATLLNHSANESAYVVGILDAAIYNSKNIKHILLTLYRHNRFLIGPTSAFVTAGAIASTYSTQVQLSSQIAKLIHTNSTGVAGHYANDFKVTINKQVARSLNYALPDEGDLEKRIKQWEHQNDNTSSSDSKPTKTDADHNPAKGSTHSLRAISDN
jgi:hypothetical protein